MRPALMTMILLLLSLGQAAAWAACTPSERVVAVDAGHGPNRPGATSARGAPEYEFNLALARQVVAALHEAGFPKAFLLDPKGSDLSPSARARRAKAAHAGLLLSIHHDSAQAQFLEPWTVDGRRLRHSEQFAGYALFYSQRNARAEDSLKLARQIGQALRQAGLDFTRHHAADIPGERRQLVDETVGIYRYDGLAVLHQASMPAVLLEAGVIINKEEEAALASVTRQRRTALAVARGVAAFCAAKQPAYRTLRQR